MNQEEIDNKLSELRQQIWIELWALDDASVILEKEDNHIIMVSLKSGNRLKLDYPKELSGDINAIFLETLRQEFVNVKIIEFDYHELTDKLDSTLLRIERGILDDYRGWKDKINTMINRVNEASMVLNEQVQRK